MEATTHSTTQPPPTRKAENPLVQRGLSAWSGAMRVALDRLGLADVPESWLDALIRQRHDESEVTLAIVRFQAENVLDILSLHEFEGKAFDGRAFLSGLVAEAGGGRMIAEPAVTESELLDIAKSIREAAERIHVAAAGFARIGSKKDVATVIAAGLIEEIGLPHDRSLKIGLVLASRLNSYMGAEPVEAVAS